MNKREASFVQQQEIEDLEQQQRFLEVFLVYEEFEGYTLSQIVWDRR